MFVQSLTIKLNVRFVFFIMGALFVIAFCCSSTNFVSAETNCYTSGERWVCVFTSTDPPAKAVVFCDTNGNNCTVTWLDKVNVVPPGIKSTIDATVKEEMQNNVKDGKDIGDLKNDNDIQLSPNSK